MHTKTIKYTSPEEKFIKETLKNISEYEKAKLLEEIKTIR